MLSVLLSALCPPSPLKSLTFWRYTNQIIIIIIIIIISDTMTSRLPRYEAKCVQRRYFQWGLVPLRSDVKGTELPPAITRKAIDCATTLVLTVFLATVCKTVCPILSVRCLSVRCQDYSYLGLFAP